MVMRKEIVVFGLLVVTLFLIPFKNLKKEREEVYKSKISGNNMIIPGDPSGLPDDLINVAVFIDNAYLNRFKNYFFKEKFSYFVENFVVCLTRKDNCVEIYFGNKLNMEDFEKLRFSHPLRRVLMRFPSEIEVIQ
ncbi:hypothetical protein CMI42_02155, partial [Candidatus Pacearchaeota archaeon]|nr:hypothetical protein [Candidatus Pacearchaeota archaeon]